MRRGLIPELIPTSNKEKVPLKSPDFVEAVHKQVDGLSGLYRKPKPAFYLESVLNTTNECLGSWNVDESLVLFFVPR
jgi:hypothetical protein